MKIFRKISEYADYQRDISGNNLMVGFVPTMGALHQGHLSLIEKCSKENQVTVVSIFVNPTQFNDSNDFKKYPRDENKDFRLLEGVLSEMDVVFCPDVTEMYPKPDTRQFDFAYLESVFEGADRPGHFNGVAQVVSRLFEIIKPRRAYFGEKDYQQLLIIKKLVHMLNLEVEIVPCPLIREQDGLAMSSRNQRLSSEERKEAAEISKTLFEARLLFPLRDINDIREFVSEKINSSKLLKLAYFDVVNAETLCAAEDTDNEKLIALIAVIVGNVRLIDNVKLNF
jgi:pantoate--beta-alanine ligase